VEIPFKNKSQGVKQFTATAVGRVYSGCAEALKSGETCPLEKPDMKKMLMLSGLVAVLAACGGNNTHDERTNDESSLATVKSELTVCGYGCGSGDGNYVNGYACGTAVGGTSCPGDSCYESTFTKNITNCWAIPDTGYFIPCGLNAYPTSSRYLSEYRYHSNCSIEYPGDSSLKNQTRYEPIPTGSAGIFVCGSSCPTGFTVYSSQYATTCSTANPAPSTGSNNQVNCRNY
jgi:hypothetical protein